MKYFFTADEHLGHINILKYCNRPFDSVEQMDNEIIKRFNSVVSPNDIVYHLGDFTMKSEKVAENYIRRLNGRHIFLKGSHDYWADKVGYSINEKADLALPYQIFEKEIEGTWIVMCHYPMREWPRSFHGSIQLFGHCHGKLKETSANQLDVGVDTNNYFPYSLEDIINIIKNNQKKHDKK